MDIIRIGNEAMKISLCTNEAIEFGFSDIQSEEEMKEKFLSLLIRAKEQIDYAVLDKRITGEIFSGRDGSCEIFVSRVEARDKVYKDRFPEDAVKKTKQTCAIFAFDNVNKLLNVTKRLDEISYEGTSSVYYDYEKGKYYIILEDVSVKELKYAFISEYSCPVKGNLSQYIKEHFKCICKKDGVKILSRC